MPFWTPCRARSPALASSGWPSPASCRVGGYEAAVALAGGAVELAQTAMRKLGAVNRTQAVAIAPRHPLFDVWKPRVPPSLRAREQTSMRVAQIREFGGIEALRLEETAEPNPGPDEVLIKVTAVGLNFFDTLSLRNEYQVTPRLPYSPGAEIAGTIEA